MKSSDKSSYANLIACTLYFSVLFQGCFCSTNQYGVLAAESSTEKEKFCIIFFREFAALPEEKSKAEFRILQDDSELDWCEANPGNTPQNKVLLLTMGNCSITTQALNVQEKGGKAVFFLAPSGRVQNYDVNDTDSEFVNITVGLISENSAQRLKQMGNTVTVRLFAPVSQNFDFSLLVIWLIAMSTIFVGSYWSGRIRHEIYQNELSLPCSTCREEPSDNRLHGKPKFVEPSSLYVKPIFMVFFVCLMASMLVLLYFLYDYLVYFIIGLFVIASCIAVHGCLENLVLKIPGNFCISKFPCAGRSCKLDFRELLLIAFAIGISVFWVVVRNERYAWVLQDILGVVFCVHMLKSIRLQHLKICALLLILLFFYDIFFVFITPFLTSKGESVMEHVATGGKSTEMLPMVFKVPHFGFNPVAVCYQQFSLLGYGDILIPGLLISYCHAYDLFAGGKKIYFMTAVTSYGIGMILTFVALFLMSAAQPALLYLVPCTLIPIVILGYFRGELRALWNGYKIDKAAKTVTCPEVHVAADNPRTDPSNQDPVLPPLADGFSPKDLVPSNEGAGETNLLLQ